MSEPPKDERPRRVSARRGAVVLAAGSGVNFVLNILRSIILARLLTVADFGIAGTFMAALNLIQMASNFNFQTLLVQHRSGDDQDFGAAIKALAMARQVLVAAVIVVFAGPLAQLMGQPELTWAYRLMAVVPLLGAFRHTDLVRMKRNLRFGPHFVNEFAANVVVLAMIWPLALVLGDYRVIVVIYLVQALVQVVGSHLQAETPFRVRWDWEVARIGFRFGWPLMLSGLVLFAVFQGDRLIVAHFYTAQDLGLIAVALTTVTVPVLFLAQMVRTYFLSILSRHQDHDRRFGSRAAFTLQATLCCGLLASLGFALLGPPVVVLAFGAKYAEAGAFMAFLGIGFSVQLMRAGSNVVAMARADTLNMLVSNCVRVAFLPLAVLMALRGADLVSVLVVGAVGQVVGLMVSVAMLYVRTGLRNWSDMAGPYAAGLACVLCLFVAALQAPFGYATPGLATGLSAAFFLLSLGLSRQVWSEVKALLGRRRP